VPQVVLAISIADTANLIVGQVAELIDVGVFATAPLRGAR
jgi:hypothetical protein